jgi:hypothetical protein
VSYEAESHAESEKSSDVGHERGPGHALIANDVSGERVLDVHAQPKQVVARVRVQHLEAFPLEKFQKVSKINKTIFVKRNRLDGLQF